MPGPSAVLFNHDTNTYENVPADKVGEALASQRYTSSGTTSTQAEGGTVTRPAEQLGAAEAQGEVEAGGINAARSSASRLELQKALDSDKFLSFSEGVADAWSMGLVHGTSEEDELRREADSGSALLGQLVGTVLGLKLPGPIKGVTAGGEALGEGLARALMGEASTGFRGVVTRGLAEAGANSALMVASAFGHQITDSVIADKPFAAESIASEAGVGALLGFGGGFLGSGFGQLARASRGAVEASGVAVKESRAALDAVADLTRGWDDTVNQHAQRVGVLKVLAEEGQGVEFGHQVDYRYRAQLLDEAQTAQKSLRELDNIRALGGDPAEFQKWRGAVEAYQEAVTKLNDSMAPSLIERAKLTPVQAKPPTIGSDLERGIGPLDPDAAEAAKGLRSPMSMELDTGMRGGSQDNWTHLKGVSSAELQAKYSEIYGRPFEETPGVGGATDESNLGGRQSATSEGKTGVASGRARQVMEAGNPPAGIAETGQDFVDATKKHLLSLPPGEGVPVTESPIPEGGGQQAIKNYMTDWFKEYDSKPRVNLADQMQVRLTQALDSIAKVSGSRLDSAGSLALLKSLGLKEATSPIGQRLDQVWSLGQAGKFAADEARGVKTPLRKGLVGQLQRFATNRGSRAIGGALFGAAAGGPVGAIVGMALTSAGFAGAAASTAGRLMQQIATVGEALLKGKRAMLVARAVAGNRPYQYSDAGVIKDPVQRIMEVQRLAANPAAIRARVTHQLGDLAMTSPEMAHHLMETTLAHIQAISASAPAIALSPLGTPIQPSGDALRKFFDFENAMHDLPGTLTAIQSGGASKAQISALHIGFPAVHAELVKNIIGDSKTLTSLNESRLKVIERSLGISLTRATADPLVTARFQGNWEAPKPQPKPAQAFKITAPKPTPTQAGSSGRAPGNERKTP